MNNQRQCFTCLILLAITVGDLGVLYGNEASMGAPTESTQPPADNNPVRARPVPSPDPSSRQAEAIEVTSMLQERPVDESPVPVLILHREELERTGSQDLAQALESASGVVVDLTPASARGGGQGIAIQGIEGKQVLVLLNGRPFVGDSDGIVDISSIPVSMVQRVEMVAGPMAAMYGTGAIGGVVNIITKSAEIGEGGPHLHTNVRRSSYETYEASQALSYGAKSMSLLAIGNYRASAGFDLDPEQLDTDGETYRKSSWFSSFSWKANSGLDLRIDLLADTGERSKVYTEDLTLTLGKYYNYDWTWDERRAFLTGSFQWQGAKAWLSGWLSTSYYARKYSETVQGGLEATYRDTNSGTLDFRLQGNRSVRQTLLLLGGIESHRSSVDIQAVYVDAEGVAADPQSEVANKSLANVEAFALADYTVWDGRFEMYAGARGTYTSRFGFYPPVSINLRLNPWQSMNLRGSVGLGYRAPNLKELNYFFDHSAFGYVILGNPDLIPERSVSSNFSIEYDWISRGVVRFGYFFNDIVDLIDYMEVDRDDVENESSLPENVQIFELNNYSDGAITQGIDSIAKLNWQPFTVSAGYQYLDARNKLYGYHLLYRSRHSGKINATWNVFNSGVSFSGVARYQGSQVVDDGGEISDPSSCLSGYTDILTASSWNQDAIEMAESACFIHSDPFWVLDASASTRFRLPSGPLTLQFYGGINNIFDIVRDPTALSTSNTEGSQTLDVRPVPGRVFYFGLRGEI